MGGVLDLQGKIMSLKRRHSDVAPRVYSLRTEYRLVFSVKARSVTPSRGSKYAAVDRSLGKFVGIIFFPGREHRWECPV